MKLMKGTRWLCACMALVFLLGSAPAAIAVENTDPAVQQVITQLEEIDTLQQIQDMRNSYKASTGHYDVNTTNPAVAENHEAQRAAYESYVNEMFAKRMAAQNAYNALSESQQQQIPQALVDKLDNTLPTVFNSNTFPVTPSNDEYQYEAVNGGTGYGYEVSNYMVSGQIPQTFILVDTSDGKTSWTPDGLYECGQSNYEVLYCCDVDTRLTYSTDYKRVNLEDSGYYSKDSSDHIRGILTNCYPYISLEEMKSRLIAAGMKEDFVDQISRSDAIAAAQMAVWTYSNVIDNGSYSYFASVDIKRNTGIYFTALHDHTNEVWEWLPQARTRSYDARAEYRVNMLAYFLCQLPPVSAKAATTIASKLEVTRALVEANENGSYRVGLYVNLPSGGSDQDYLKVKVTSYQQNADGSRTMVDRTTCLADGDSKLSLCVDAWPGNTIEVTLDGYQITEKDVFFYEPRGGRNTSQSLVGIGMGKAQVHDVETFTFDEIGEMGLRIYKTVKDTGSPISDIVFNIYSVDPGDDEIVSAIPTKEEIERYAIAENLVGSLTTDNTGYAAMTLSPGIYLIEEEPNSKVKAPVDPFYVWIPMEITEENEDGTLRVETLNIVSVYPKNEPPLVPPPPPPPPPPKVVGQFAISKYDEDDPSVKLQGAQFAVYTTAKEGDTDIETITVNNIQYSVVPVIVNGAPLVLETDENGYAISPELECDTYHLVEIKAPNGYFTLDEMKSITVVPNTVQDITLIEISNRRGHLLPETGGIGTTVFTVSGMALTAVAFTLLAWKKRCRYCDDSYQ